MKKSTKAKLAAGGLLIGGLFQLASCKNETTPAPTCNCPKGTVHLDKETNCCDGADCDCINQYDIYFGTKKIIVKDKTRSVRRETIQNALDIYESVGGLSSSSMYIKNSTKDIIMIVDNIGPNYLTGNPFYASANYLNNTTSEYIGFDLFPEVFGMMTGIDLLGSARGRVEPGSYLPGAPTDPDVPNFRTAGTRHPVPLGERRGDSH
jgi:hypothetical protein